MGLDSLAAAAGRSVVAACGIKGCSECIQVTQTCIKCVHVPRLWFLPDRSFELDGNHCYLPADRVLTHFGSGLLFAIVGLVLIAALMQMAIVMLRKSSTERTRNEHGHSLLREQGPCGDEPPLLQFGNHSVCRADFEGLGEADQRERSTKAIAHGLSSWLQRQMRNWAADIDEDPHKFRNPITPRRYNPCTTDIGGTYIMGVGLPLFYGFKFLVFFSAAATALVLFIVQTVSGLEPMLEQITAESHAGVAVNSLPDDALLAYSERMFYSLGALFVILYVFSVCHFVRQQQFVREFDNGNSSMADFALHIRGLPRDMISEGRLKALVEKQMDCPGEVVGVSIGYDLSDAETRDRVFNMIENRVVRADVGFYMLGNDLSKHGWGYEPSLAKKEQLDAQKDRETFRQLWDERRLQGSGHAFVVFKQKAFVSAANQRFRGFWVQSEVTLTAQELMDPQFNFLRDRGAQLEGRLRDHTMQNSLESRKFVVNAKEIFVRHQRFLAGTRFYDPDSVRPGKPIVVETCMQVTDEALEPTSTLWFNFGQPRPQRRRNERKHICNIAITWLVITLVVYTPLFYFLVTPCGLAKMEPGPVASQVQGILLAIAGNVLGMVNWNSVSSIGYFSKAQQDEHFVVFSTFANLFNSILFIGAGLSYYISVGFNQVDLTSVHNNTVGSFLLERELFDAYYNMMIPGWLFAGVLTGKLMGWFMPVIQNYVLTRVVFVHQCLPDPLRQLLTAAIPWNPRIDEWLSARHAEHAFEPPEVALAWEYNAYIITPLICYVVLFVMSPRSWRVFGMLAFWALFMIVMHRYVTLLISRKHTTGYRVDLLATKLWGVVPATVLAAFGFWGVRCNKFGDNASMTSYWIVLFLFLLGAAVHRLTLSMLEAPREVVDLDRKDRTYAQTVAELRYTWFNTNPVHVLKSCYYPEVLGEGMEQVMAPVPFEFGKEYLQLPEDWSFLDSQGKPVSEEPDSWAKMGCYGGFR